MVKAKSEILKIGGMFLRVRVYIKEKGFFERGFSERFY